MNSVAAGKEWGGGGGGGREMKPKWAHSHTAKPKYHILLDMLRQYFAVFGYLYNPSSAGRLPIGELHVRKETISDFENDQRTTESTQFFSMAKAASHSTM